MNNSYKKYQEILKKIADVNYSSALLSWDQETYMPEKGAEFRAQQLATLAGIAHDMSITDELGNLLIELNRQDLDEEQKRDVEESLKDYNKRKKYPTEFVEILSRAVSEAFQAWQTAKKNNDFNHFAPFLKKLVDLKRKECELLGYKNHPYDALLDQYEPGATTADLDILFKDVKEQMVEFVQQIFKSKQNDDSFMYKHYDKEKQWQFGIDLLKQMGYDFAAGRQDISTHPFTIHFNPLDVRVTTRISENNISEMIWSCIHEGGHALYEQGLKKENYGLPSGEAVSLGIHESQSRLWENNVGRSINYWRTNYPKLQQLFPENLSSVSLEDFYRAMNIVEPSLVRTSADELTYHFHILIRYEIEKALIEGSITVDELPSYWNRKYKEYLNVDVPSNDKGVLQDIHWSHGSFGYFPTYSLGSFYAAQFYHFAQQQMPGLLEEINNGNMAPLLAWLRENIHQFGKFYSAEELCVSLTGEKLNFKYFMDYARVKYSGIYENVN